MHTVSTLQWSIFMAAASITTAAGCGIATDPDLASLIVDTAVWRLATLAKQ